MEKHKVSIIVPVYNVEEYVGECIESIIGQTYINLEILINDDGSSDGSYGVCQHYAGMDGRIRLYHEERSGVSICRNRMLEKATGDYILFVDSDDILLPEHVERLVALLEEYDADASACGYRISRMGRVRIPENRKWKVLTFSGPEFADKITKLIGYRCFPWGRLYRRELLADFRFPEGRTFEDAVAIPQLVYKLKKIVYTNEPLYIYRYRSDSLCHESFSLRRADDELHSYNCIARLGFEKDSRELCRNGALSFVLVYMRSRIAMSMKGMDQKAFRREYSQYQRMYLHMLLTRRYRHSSLLDREQKPLERREGAGDPSDDASR